MSSIRAALEQDGQPEEGGWPYLAAVPADLALWVPPSNVGALFRRPSKVLTGGFAEAWAAVTADTPVLIGMSISDAFYMPDAEGVIDSPEAVDPDRRHAVVAAGTGDRGGKQYLLVRNSWGDTWGLAGYAWLAEAYLSPRILRMVTKP